MSLAADVLLRRVFGSVLLLLLAGPAMATEPWKAVARVASAEDAALLERVRGQSSDLPLLLVAESGAALEGLPSARWRAVEGLARRHRARAVLWFLRAGSEVQVHVAEPASRHLFVRTARLAGEPGSLAWSAGAEALALAVRSALRAVELGKPLGEVVEPLATQAPGFAPAPVATAEASLSHSGASGRVATAGAAREPPGASGRVKAEEASPSPSGTSGRVTAAEASLSPSGPPGRWMLAVGAHASLDGYARKGHQGLLLGAGWEGRSLRLGVQLLAGLPARLSDEHTRLILGQHAAVLGADVPFGPTGPLGCAAGLEAGAVVFTRRTEALAAEVDAAPPSVMVALLLGPRLSARWRASTRLALEASFSAELLLGRPALGYALDGNFVPRGDGWAVRPRLGLAMVFLP